MSDKQKERIAVGPHVEITEHGAINLLHSVTCSDRDLEREAGCDCGVETLAIIEASREIERLRSLLAERAEDTERVDWMISHCATVTSVDVHDHNTGRGFAEIYVEWLDDDDNARSFQSDSANAREVIDAARSSGGNTK